MVVRGAGFVAGMELLIGGVRASDVTVSSREELTATTPAHSVGAVDVTVRLQGSESTLSGGFSYLAPPPNLPPVIMSLVARGRQDHEPDSYAAAGETIDVTATVRDDDTPASELTFEWSCDAGTFTGTGRQVAWTAPAAPAKVALRLTVRDREPFAGQAATAAVDVAVHDSVREIADMARQFLIDFSDQKLSPLDVVRNFRDGCGAGGTGKRDEQQQVADNHVNWLITRYSVGVPHVTVRFGGTCPFRARTSDACAQVDVSWTSTRLTDPTSPQDPPKGSSGTTAGIDQVTAEYTDGRWWLCDSDFDSHDNLGRSGFRRPPFMLVK